MLQACSHISICFAVLSLFCAACSAQEEKTGGPGKTISAAKPTSRTKASKKDPSAETEASPGIQLFAPRKMEMQFGMRVNSNQNICSNLLATMPFPLNWPEQTVKVINSQIPPNVTWQWRDLPIGAKQSALARQLVMKAAILSPNSQLNLLIDVEIEKSFINPPPDTTVFVIPKKVPQKMDMFLQSSPYIEIDLGEIRKVAKQIAADDPQNAWAQVEKLYDWVRDNMHYKNGKTRQIREALKDKTGDCEEMTGIFVALCRASKIPARCVWIPDHCYPEFYLEDPQGEGHWFPCQVAGERQFGQMHDYRPILQKGDKFKVPEDNAPLRYVPRFFTCKQRASGPGVDPSVDEVMDLGPLKAEMEALRQQNEPK